MDVDERIARLEVEVANLKEYIRNDLTTEIQSLRKEVAQKFSLSIKLFIAEFAILIGLIGSLIASMSMG